VPLHDRVLGRPCHATQRKDGDKEA